MHDKKIELSLVRELINKVLRMLAIKFYNYNKSLLRYINIIILLL